MNYEKMTHEKNLKSQQKNISTILSAPLNRLLNIDKYILQKNIQNKITSYNRDIIKTIIDPQNKIALNDKDIIKTIIDPQNKIALNDKDIIKPNIDPQNKIALNDKDIIKPNIDPQNKITSNNRDTIKQITDPQNNAHDKHTLKKIKISAGIACCRYHKGQRQLLLVRKRYTYAFNDFVHGRYNSNCDSEIINILNQTTLEEKLEILSLNFNLLWHKIWLSDKPGINNVYFLARNKFQHTFLEDNGARLRKLIGRAKNSQLLWELPKGHRINKYESEIECAVREFEEETGIQKKHYFIYPQFRRVYSFIDANTKYVFIYYFALIKNEFIDICKTICQQKLVKIYSEISDIQWASIEMIRLIDQDKKLENITQPIFNFARRVVRPKYGHN